jgi:MFS family permease
MSAACRRNALVPVLIFTTMVAAIVSSLGAPLIPTISRQFHVSVSSAQWSLTVALLAGAISAPIMGRLGDGPRRRETLIAGLVAVALGGVVAALATSLAVLVLGRALQGIGLGLASTFQPNRSPRRSPCSRCAPPPASAPAIRSAG